MRGPIVLIGNMGAGKTSVGKELSRLLGWHLIDIDRVVELQEGMTIQEIFQERGKASFRGLESMALGTSCADPFSIISCGGGIVESEKNVSVLKECPHVVYLMADVDTLASRVGNGSTRPLLKDGVKNTLERLQKRRDPLYRALATIVVDTSDMSAQDVAALILQRLGDSDES